MKKQILTFMRKIFQLFYFIIDLISNESQIFCFKLIFNKLLISNLNFISEHIFNVYQTREYMRTNA